MDPPPPSVPSEPLVHSPTHLFRLVQCHSRDGPEKHSEISRKVAKVQIGHVVEAKVTAEEI